PPAAAPARRARSSAVCRRPRPQRAGLDRGRWGARPCSDRRRLRSLRPVTVSTADATAHDFEAVSASGTPLLFSWRFLQLLSTATGYPNRSVVLQRGGRRFLLPVLRRRALGIYPLDFSLPFGHHGAIFPAPAAGAE